MSTTWREVFVEVAGGDTAIQQKLASRKESSSAPISNAPTRGDGTPDAARGAGDNANLSLQSLQDGPEGRLIMLIK